MSWNYYALEKIAQERQQEALDAAERDQLLALNPRVELRKTPSLPRRLLHRTGAWLIGIGLWLQGTQDRIGDLS